MRAILALTAYFLRSFEDILDGKLDGKFIFLGMLVNKNNRLYGTKNCRRNHCFIALVF